MSRPTSGKHRPMSGTRTLKAQSADVVSYEDLLVAQYLEELKKSPPYTKTSSTTQPSPYLQRLTHSHIVPAGGRQRPYSATVGSIATSKYGGKPRIDPKFIADPALWDPVSPRDESHHCQHDHKAVNPRRRPISAPVYRRPLSGYSRPGSAKTGRRTKALYKRQPLTLVVIAFRNGSRDNFARIAAPSIKVLLEMSTDKLSLPGAARRVFLDDGEEAFTPQDIPRDAEVYISCGEPFKDPFKPMKKQTNMSKSTAWTMNGLTWNQDRQKKTKPHMTKRFKALVEQSRRRVLVFKNGSGTNGVEIVADPERFEDFLVACTAKCELGSYARVLYDWEGNAVGDLEEAPVLDKCLQASSTPVLGPLWVSKGEGFSPKGVDEFLQGLIKYTRAKLKEARHYRTQLQLAQSSDTRNSVEIVAILSMTESEIDETLVIVAHDVDEFSNALNRLKEQHKNILSALGDEEDQGKSYTMKHIDELDLDHKLVGTKGIRLRIYENGTDDNETVVYFNMQSAERGLKKQSDRQKLMMERFLSECSSSSALGNPKKNPTIRPVARKIFNEVGKEIKEVYDFTYDQCLWLSYGEPWKNPFLYVMSVTFDKVRVFDVEGSENEAARRTGVREQLMKEDIEGNDKASGWEVSHGLPADYKNTTIIHSKMDPMEREQSLAIIESGEILVHDTSFLISKENTDLIVYPELVIDVKRKKPSNEVWPPEAQSFVLSKDGYICNRAMPQLVLSVSDQKLKGTVSHPTKGKSKAEAEGYVVGLQKKNYSLQQQWIFSKDGLICPRSHSELALTFLGSQVGQEDTQVQNTEEGGKNGQRYYIGVCEKLQGKMAKSQRFAIKQEKFENLGQWKYNRVENPEWNKRALSWPTDENGDLNNEYDWPMEGYFVAYAPPVSKKQVGVPLSGSAPLRLLVMKNGVRDISKANPVVGPDLNNMRKDLHTKDKKKKKQTGDEIETESIDVDGLVHCDEDLTVLKLEFILFLERCTNMVNLPFAGRRLFDENGKEIFSLRGLRRDQLVYASCGEAWCDPNLSKAEQQRRYLLANLASDVKQIHEYCILRSPENLVLEVDGELKAGSRVLVGECALKEEEDSNLDQQQARYLAYQQSANENQAAKDKMDEITNHGNLTAHEQAHIRADERLERLKLPWERIVDKSDDENADSEEKFFSNKEMYRRYRPKRKMDQNLTLQMQKFIFEDGYIACASNTNLVLGMHEAEGGQKSDVTLVKRRPDDIFQRWIMQENGIIQCKNNPTLVLSVLMPVYQTKSEDEGLASYCGSQVIVQRKKTAQFGRANQRFYFDEGTGFIQAFHTDMMDKEITAANRANVCTFSVMGVTEIDQPGYVSEIQVEKGAKPKRLLVCSSCARAMRGRYKLEKITDSIDFSCAMGSAKDHGVKQVGSFQCLNGKVDLSTHEAEHTLDEWETQLNRLRDECSVRAIAKEISAAKVPYTVKVLAYRNGEGRIKPGEIIVGSSVPGILEQATHRISLSQAGRRLYTSDGTIILDIDDLVDWTREQYVKNARKQLRAERRAARQGAEENKSKSGKVNDSKLMDNVNLESDVSSSEEEQSHEEEEEEQQKEESEEGFIIGYEVQEDRKHMDELSNTIVVPNPLEPIEKNGFIMHWILFAKKPGQIYLMVVRPNEADPMTVNVVAMAPYTVTSRGEHQVDVSHYPMECRQGDLIAFYCQDNPMIPYDIDDSVDQNFLYCMPRHKPEVGKNIKMDAWAQGGSKQYSINAFAVLSHKVKINRKTRPKSAKPTQLSRQFNKKKGPYIQPPPVELVLRYPIEVWVSGGEAFVKPERVEQSYEQEIQNREERAGVALELEREKHALRQMQGRRLGGQNPGEYKSTSNPTQPVYVQGHWQDPTLEELQKYDAVHQLQVHLTEVKSNQKRKSGIKTCNANTTKRLYSQPAMKRILVFPNGESIEFAQYVWGETIVQILDNSTTRLNLRKAARYIYTLEGVLASDMSDLERDQIVCVSATKQFMMPKESRQTIEVKANWGRARKRYGPRATDIMVRANANDNVDVDAFGPSVVAGGPTKPSRNSYPSSSKRK